MEINATTKSAMPIKAATLNNRMRVRMRGSGAAASKSAIVTAAEIAKCAQAPREKLSSNPPIGRIPPGPRPCRASAHRRNWADCVRHCGRRRRR
jgi:hypothetical protein